MVLRFKLWYHFQLSFYFIKQIFVLSVSSIIFFELSMFLFQISFYASI